MSDKDLQFIERALAHPWMFWVYCWKWPRIVRQACAEYDLLAKERDAARTAHAEAAKANKKVWEWIHVTHRLSTTPEAIRAIFAAGKRLSILLAFFVVTNTYGQAPPYLRNQWTTNANPLALKVISTNGVHAATNVWELDFTNTATVTVSAVSNASKVMVSFTGSASGGDTIWTNYGATAYTLAVMPSRVQVYTNGTVILTNNTTAIFLSNAIVTLNLSNTPGSFVQAEPAATAAGLFRNATNSYLQTSSGAISAGYFDGSTNCRSITEDGPALAFGYYLNAKNSRATASQGGVSMGSFQLADACRTIADWGGFAGGYFINASNCYTEASRGSHSGGNLQGARDSFFSSSYGGTAAGDLGNAVNSFVDVDHGAYGAGDMGLSTNSSIIGKLGGYAGGMLRSASNAHIKASAALAVGTLTEQNSSITASNGSVAAGTVALNERIFADSGALAIGRDVASTNNWTFGIHYTNTVPFSLAVGANGTTQFRAASNSVVIRTETAPTVGQILTATDTSGTVGWSNAPAGSVVLALTTNQTLSAWVASQAYQLLVRQYDTNNVLTNATVQWPDGTFGVFTTTSNNPTWAAIDSYFLTYTNASKTITQALVLRNTFGYITNNPALAVTP